MTATYQSEFIATATKSGTPIVPRVACNMAEHS
jgi:hypothetical protein